MLSAIIHKIIDSWVASGIIKEGDRDIYEYGLDLLIFSLLNVFVVTATAIIMKRLPETLILLAVIIPLQSFGGGFHAKTHLRCFLITYIGWWAAMPVLPWVAEIPAAMVMAVSVAVVFCLAPVRHVNVPMSDEQYKKMRVFARLASLIIGSISVLFIGLVPSLSQTGIVMSMGMGIVAVSIIASRIAGCIRPAAKES